MAISVLFYYDILHCFMFKIPGNENNPGIEYIEREPNLAKRVREALLELSTTAGA